MTLLLLCSLLKAQESGASADSADAQSPTDKGAFIIGGNITVEERNPGSGSEGYRGTHYNVEIAPSLLFFIKDRLAVGGSFALGSEDFGIYLRPGIQYFHDLSNVPVQVYSSYGLVLGVFDMEYDIELQWGIMLGAGVDHFISRNIAVGFYAEYQRLLFTYDFLEKPARMQLFEFGLRLTAYIY
jgi:hypothetical protein